MPRNQYVRPKFGPRKARWRVDAIWGQSAPKPCVDRPQSMIARIRGMSLINFALYLASFTAGLDCRCSCAGCAG